MIELAKKLLWDEKFARATLLGLCVLGGAYWQSPSGRPWQERLINAVFVAAPTGVASLSGGSRKGE